MAKKIVVTSGKGGVGKTTVSACLSASLSKKGKRVLVCDADFALNNIDILTGVENRITYDIVDIVEGRCRAKQALVKHPDYPNLHILTSIHTTPERYISPQSLKAVLESLAPQFDYIIIDCPAGLDEGFHRAVACADEAIVVTTPQISALRDADKVINLLSSYRLDKLSLIVNKVRGDLLVKGESLSLVEIAELLKIPLLGALPEEFVVYKGDFTRIHPAFKLLANNLLNEKIKLYDCAKRYTGVTGALRRILKRCL